MQKLEMTNISYYDSIIRKKKQRKQTEIDKVSLKYIKVYNQAETGKYSVDLNVLDISFRTLTVFNNVIHNAI